MGVQPRVDARKTGQVSELLSMIQPVCPQQLKLAFQTAPVAWSFLSVASPVTARRAHGLPGLSSGHSHLGHSLLASVGNTVVI